MIYADCLLKRHGARWLLMAATLGLLVATAQSSWAQTLTTLYRFTGMGGDGALPEAGVVMDAQGNLYGTTLGGGDRSGDGTAYEVTQGGAETILHTFNGGTNAHPMAGLFLDAKGNLYGTTVGRNYATGIAFEISNEGKEKVLFNFASTPAASQPLASLVMDASGNLYGTTLRSNPLVGEGGTVFKLTPKKRGKDMLNVLYTFSGADGYAPIAGVVFDKEGNLYGTTAYGGSYANCIHGESCGVVFELTPSGMERVLYSFAGLADGAYPNSGGVILDGRGNLYGATVWGGITNSACPQGCGVIFKVSQSGQETVLYSFTGGAEGAFPHSGVVMDAEGNLYGTAYNGGNPNCQTLYGSGCGTVFELTPSGTFTVLHSFTGADGANPVGQLIFDGQGNLYGATEAGGIGCKFAYSSGCGTVFKLIP